MLKLSTPNAERQGLASRFAKPRVMRGVRRFHMYLGLFLMPWLAFFGCSGVLFNHPNVGETVTSRRVAPERLLSATGFTAWQPEQLAARVTSELGARDPARRYRLDPAFAARFTGSLVMKAPSEEGLHLLLLDPQRGFGILAHRKARPSGTPAPFAGSTIELPEYSLAALNERFHGLLAAEGLASKAPLRADPELAPQLEFRIEDEAGRRWNATYDLNTGSVAGRLESEWPRLGVAQLLAKLHTTHHFTFGVKARWFWALFEDLLGIAMVLWAITGLFMWWQLRATRVIGVVSLLAALGVFAAVSIGTARELLFGDVPQQLGPGK